MNPRDKAEAQAREAMASTLGTLESVTAAAPVFASREAAEEAMQAKGWAVFVSESGSYLMGAPRGNPTEDGCPCCSGVEAVQLDGERLLAAEVSIFVNVASWGDGPMEQRGITIDHQGARKDLEEVVVRLDTIPTPQEALQILEECAQKEAREAAIAESKEAIEAALDGGGYLDLYRKGEDDYYFPREDGLDVYVNGTANGERVDFFLDVRIKSDRTSWFWEHRAFDHMPPGIDASVTYRSKPSIVPAPERIMQDLYRRRDEHLDYLEYVEAKPECGPGEEPDMEQWRRKVAEHQERERKRRDHLNRATGGMSHGMLGGVAHPNATGTPLAVCPECCDVTEVGILEVVGEELAFRPIHEWCLQKLRKEELEDPPSSDELRTFGVWVKDRGDGEIMHIPYEPGNG